MGVLISALGTGLNALNTAAQFALSGASGLLGGGSAGAGALGAAGAAPTFATAAGAIPAAVAVTPAVPLGATVGAATEAAVGGASIFTKAATAAALGSATAGILQATKAPPDLPKPPAPPSPPTLADPAVQAAGMDARQRAAARGGMGFGNTVTNKGGAQGLAASPDLLGTRTLLG